MILSLNGIIAGKGVVIPASTLNVGIVSAYNAESNTTDSLSVNNGTAIGGLTYTIGKIGNAFNLNGTNSYVELGDVMDLGLSSWTYSTWFNCSNATLNNNILSKAFAGGSTGRVFMSVWTNKLYFGVQVSNTEVNMIETDSSLTINNNNWYNATFVVDRTDKLKIYVNGSLQGVVQVEGTNNLIPYSAVNYNTNHPFRIGAYTFSDNVSAMNFFNGKIDAVGIWNRVLTPTEITELYNCGSGKQYPFTGSLTLDSDACAFIASAGITDSTQKNAINTLVLDLKSANIWTKMKAIYPFVGGTALSHKFNLKDPRDLDAAFRLVFAGGWTHSSNGVLPNGTNTYADTKITASLYLVNNDNHYSFYNNGSVSNAETTIDMGAGDSFGEVYMWTYREDFTLKYDNGSSITNRVSATTNNKGFSIGSRTNNTTQKIYKNGILLNTNTNTNTNTLPNSDILISAGNINGVVSFYSNKQSAFASIGSGLSDSEVTAFYNAVQRYQTALGRQV